MIMESNLRKLRSIPEDVIIDDILLRLPVKSLLRFKSVFSFRSNDKSATILSPDLRIPVYGNHHVAGIVGSRNGIVCYYDNKSLIFLCNPATREFKQLPYSFLWKKHRPCHYHAVRYGFGFDSSNIYDFKVIRLLHLFRPSREVRAEMYTLSSNKWRTIQWVSDSITFHYFPQDSPGSSLFCANSFHWIVRYRDNPYRQTILSCDIRRESFKMMDLPRKQRFGGHDEFSLIEFKEFVSCTLYRAEEKCLLVWIMKEYGDVESWTKLYSIRMSNLGFGRSSSICFWMDYNELLVLRRYFKAPPLSCNLKTLDLESVEIDGYEKYRIQRYFEVAVHEETLVSIQGRLLV